MIPIDSSKKNYANQSHWWAYKIIFAIIGEK